MSRICPLLGQNLQQPWTSSQEGSRVLPGRAFSCLAPWAHFKELSVGVMVLLLRHSWLYGRLFKTTNTDVHIGHWDSILNHLTSLKSWKFHTRWMEIVTQKKSHLSTGNKFGLCLHVVRVWSLGTRQAQLKRLSTGLSLAQFYKLWQAQGWEEMGSYWVFGNKKNQRSSWKCENLLIDEGKC